MIHERKIEVGQFWHKRKRNAWPPYGFFVVLWDRYHVYYTSMNHNGSLNFNHLYRLTGKSFIKKYKKDSYHTSQSRQQSGSWRSISDEIELKILDGMTTMNFLHNLNRGGIDV